MKTKLGDTCIQPNPVWVSHLADDSEHRSEAKTPPLTGFVSPCGVAGLSKLEFLVTEASWEECFSDMKISFVGSRWQGSDPKWPSAIKFLVIWIQ